MIQLQAVRPKPAFEEQSGFPFDVPAVRTLEHLEFASAVTILVGENGSGKSTLLEALAAGARLPTVGGASIDRAPELADARRLAGFLTFSWASRKHRGFFLRAEDFFGFTRGVKQSIQELDRLADHYDKTATGYGRLMARGAVLGQREALVKKYGEDPDAFSHGESFLRLFQSRFVPEGLYLLDEPEAPLSPRRQISFLALLLDMVKRGGQFIIATHSPMIMACPGAVILNFDSVPVRPAPYSELDHVFITRTFLNNPEQYLKHLRDD